MQIVATGLPATIEDYQTALNAAFAGGQAYGLAKGKLDYDLSKVIRLTHVKTQSIIADRGYAVTGFVLTKIGPNGAGKCIVDMSAVRWFDEAIEFQRMMHPH